MKKLIVGALALFALCTTGIAFAQTNLAGAGTPSIASFAPLPVIFPIIELGGCTSKDACRVYCDDSAHQDACFAYAQTHGLMRQDEIAKAKEFIKETILNGRGASTTARIASSTPPRLLPPPKGTEGSSTIANLLKKIKGPGGCTNQDECRIYCNSTAHADECLAFAKAHALMSTQEIDRAKEVLGKMGSTTPPMPPRGLATTTILRPDLRLSTSTKPGNTSVGTPPPQPFKEPPKLPTASTTQYKTPPPQPTIQTGSGSTIDYNKPPYHCTPAQAEEGACDPPSTASDQGGNIFMAMLHFFGWR